MVNEAIQILRARIKARLDAGGTTLAGIAREAGLHANALYTFDGDWNPTTDTLLRLEGWLDGNPLPPKDGRKTA